MSRPRLTCRLTACALLSLLIVPMIAFAEVYELRTYTTNEGKLDALNARFRDHTVALFDKHGMESVGYWVPTDDPESQNTLIYVLEHDSREAAQVSWNAFLDRYRAQDPRLPRADQAGTLRVRRRIEREIQVSELPRRTAVASAHGWTREATRGELRIFRALLFGALPAIQDVRCRVTFHEGEHAHFATSFFHRLPADDAIQIVITSLNEQIRE